MADEIDIANDRAMLDTDAAQRVVREAAKAIPKGEPGECFWCGEYNARLVDGVCSPCRDIRAGLSKRGFTR